MAMNNGFIVGVISIIIFASCQNGVSQASPIDIRVSSVDVEKINVDLSQTSMNGFSGVAGDSIYFFDSVLSYFHKFGIGGECGSKKLGYGRGHGELPARGVDGVCINDADGRLCVLTDITVFLCDENGVVKNKQMKYNGPISDKGSHAGYTTWNEVITRVHDDCLYYNIISTDSEVPGGADYFSKVSIIMKDNVSTGKMTPIAGYPDYYAQNDKKIKHLPYIYFDIDEDGNMLTAFQADPSIYKYNRDKYVEEQFGVPGKDMVTSYTSPGRSVEQYKRAFYKDMESAGYYYWLESVGKLIFRSYQKGGAAENDGLQIYDGTTLIGDVEVPRQFRVAGKIGQYYVSRIIMDEETGEAFFYRFKLNV